MIHGLGDGLIVHGLGDGLIDARGLSCTLRDFPRLVEIALGACLFGLYGLHDTRLDAARLAGGRLRSSTVTCSMHATLLEMCLVPAGLSRRL